MYHISSGRECDLGPSVWIEMALSKFLGAGPNKDPEEQRAFQGQKGLDVQALSSGLVTIKLESCYSFFKANNSILMNASLLDFRI